MNPTIKRLKEIMQRPDFESHGRHSVEYSALLKEAAPVLLLGMIGIRAWNLTRQDIHYRHHSFSAGLAAAGFEVRKDAPQGRPGDCLLVWNRYSSFHDTATKFEKAGGTVVVAENAYLGRDQDGHQLYALARGGHCGSGSWHTGGPERFDALNVVLAPWRDSGDKIVIRGQRGIGAPWMASPPNWHNDVAARLRKLTKRPIQVVPHPGEGAERNLDHEKYLQGAHCLVIWSSAVGVKALCMGVPVFFCAPHWICEPAAKSGITDLEAPLMDDGLRLSAMQAMAWAQFSLSEVESGYAFKCLLKS